MAAGEAAQYMDFPCLGIQAEALCNILGHPQGGVYQTRVAHENAPGNANLPGFGPLLSTRDEARNFLLQVGITAQVFHADIPAAAINIGLLNAVSTLLGQSDTFNVIRRRFGSNAVMGSGAQLITEVRADPHALTQKFCATDMLGRSLGKHSETEYGIAAVNTYMLERHDNEMNTNLRCRKEYQNRL